MCWNPRVLGVLAVAALIVAVVAPARLGQVGPVLAALVCPLSMGAAMWSMRANNPKPGAATVPPRSEARHRIEALEAEVAELRLRRASTGSR